MVDHFYLGVGCGLSVSATVLFVLNVAPVSVGLLPIGWLLLAATWAIYGTAFLS